MTAFAKIDSYTSHGNKVRGAGSLHGRVFWYLRLPVSIQVTDH